MIRIHHWHGEKTLL